MSKINLIVFLFLLCANAYALAPGTYESRNGATRSLRIKEWGNGFTLSSCAQYESIGCIKIELVVFREGENWKGNGTLVASYSGGLVLECPYNISTLISENAKGELFLSLYLPKNMFSQVYRCPRIEELGGMQWFYLPLPYVKRL